MIWQKFILKYFSNLRNIALLMTLHDHIIHNPLLVAFADSGHVYRSAACIMIHKMTWHQCIESSTLKSHHNECDDVSDYWHPDCLLNLLFKCISKKTLKLCVTGLSEGNPPSFTHKGTIMRNMFPFDDIIMDKANLRDLIAATGLVILLKLGSNCRFFSLCELQNFLMDDLENQ